MAFWRENIHSIMAAVNESERSVEDVEKVLSNARINLNELRNCSQTLYYANDFPDDSLVLMEVDNNLLEKVTKGGSLVFRGREDDEVVLCTEDQTYLVREAETSNSLLLLPELIYLNKNDVFHDDESASRTVTPQRVNGIFHTYLELSLIKPTFHRLHSMLEENLYEGKELESEKCATKYSLGDLLNVIQSSEKELKEGLQEIEAYNIEGFWRLLEFDYQSRVVMHILNFVQENSWAYDKVKRQETLKVLEELEPRCILEQCLNYFSIDLNIESEDGQNLIQLKEDKICRLFADMILRQAGKFDLKEFVDSWKLSVPEGMQTDLKQLAGLVLIERDRYPQVISRLTIWDLPECVEERFASLFKIRQKWLCEDIKPFLMDLTSEKLTIDSLLTKYSRVFTVKNERFCNAKYR